VNSTSIQFVSVATASHTWAASNKTDTTIVLIPSVAFGYPPSF
jgi:hypothetical protein